MTIDRRSVFPLVCRHKYVCMRLCAIYSVVVATGSDVDRAHARASAAVSGRWRQTVTWPGRREDGGY